MNKKYLIFLEIVAMTLASQLASGDDCASIWTAENGFVRRFDHGSLRTPFVDPDHPPVIQLVFLQWNGKHLVAGCDLHNLGSNIMKIDGREIVNELVGSKEFYPYATLEVSNTKEGDWTEVGTSPSPLEGNEISIFAPPNAPKQAVAGYGGSFDIHLDAFRLLIGKFEFGRVVLKDGGGMSQLIVLSDLLPPQKE